MTHEIASVVDRTVRHLLARGAPADRDDLVQEGWRIALESLPRYNRQKGELGGYLWVAVRLCLTNAIARWVAAVTLPQDQLGRAADFRGWAIPDLGGPLTPEVELGRAQAGRNLRAALDAVLETMDAKGQVVIGLLLIDTPPAQVASRLGISVAAVYRARKAVIRRGRASPALRQAWEGLEYPWTWGHGGDMMGSHAR